MLMTNLTVVTPENVCAAQWLFFSPGGGGERSNPPPPLFPNWSGLLPAILLFNPLIRRSREKKFAAGRWPCPVAASYVSKGTRPVDTRGSEAWRRRDQGLGWHDLRLTNLKSKQNKRRSLPPPQTRSDFLCRASIHPQTLIAQSAKVTELILWRPEGEGGSGPKDTNRRGALQTAEVSWFFSFVLFAGAKLSV